MTAIPTTTPGTPGDPVFLDATGKLPAIDGSNLTSVGASSVLTGNTLWVDKVNGNDGTAVRGRLDKPYLTISAAITAASSGDVVLVLAGTYNETLTMKAGVSVRGLDCYNCIIQRASAVSETVVVMSTSMVFSDFTLNLNPSANTTTGISFPAGTSNSTSFCDRITIVPTPTGTGVVNAVADAGTGAADPKSWATLRSCIVRGKDAAGGATVTGLSKTGAGTSIYRGCTLDGGTGIGLSVSGGVLYLFGCRATGTANGLSQTSGTPTTFADETTSFSSRNLTSGSLLADTVFNTVEALAAVSSPNAIDDSLAAPPTVAGTVSVTNGNATVTGSGTSFTTALAIGMVIRIGNQTGVSYTILAIASNTSLTLTTTFSGTTNGSTTLMGIREGDAYVAFTSPSGPWSTFAKGDLLVWQGTTVAALLGTANVQNGSPTVVGTGTSFTNLGVGGVVQFASQAGTNYVILSIASDTSMTLSTNYGGTTNAATTATVTQTWIRLSKGTGAVPATGLVVLVTALQGTAAGSFAGKSGQYGIYDGTAWRFWTPQPGQMTAVAGNGDPLEGATGAYRVSTASWLFAGPSRVVSATGTITTTTNGPPDVLAASMVVTPVAGTYDVWFCGAVWQGTTGAGDWVNASIYAGGVQDANSPRQAADAVNFNTPFTCIARVAVNGLQAIEGRWSRSATAVGTASMPGTRELYLIRRA